MQKESLKTLLMMASEMRSTKVLMRLELIDRQVLMQMELLIKMKALGEGLLRTEVSMKAL